MSFGQPFFLFGLLLVPLLGLFLVWANRRREKLLARLGDLGLIEKLAESLNERGRRWQQRLWLIGLALIVFALARPQWGTNTQVVQQEGIQIMVALDISASMLAQDLQPDRLTRAKQTIIELMAQLRGDQVGLVLFSGASFIQFPLTNDYDTARSFLVSATPGMISRPGTAIADAIRTARTGFDATRSSQKVIIIMTDGESHEGDALAESADALANNVTIYTIGFGSPDGEPIPEFDQAGNILGYKRDVAGEVILSRLDEAGLTQIAEMGGGAYFRASASGAEIRALAEILDRLESAELESRFEVQAVERFQLFLLLGILCLVAAELIPERRRRPRRTFEELVTTFVLCWLLVGCATPVNNEGAQLIAQGNEDFAAAAYDEAIDDYTAARGVGVESAEPIYNSANALFRQSQYAETEQTMQNAIALAEDDLRAASWFNLGNTYFVQQQWEEAVEAYKEALRLDPTDMEAKYNLELALLQINQPTPTPTLTPTPQEDSSSPEEEEPTPTPEGGSDSEEEEGSEEEQENSEESPTPTEESAESGDEGEDESDEGEGGQAEETPEPTPAPENSEPQAQGQGGELTQEQAEQLLEAVGQGTQTLQERLQQIYTVPGGQPSKDY